jgi:urease accessory protein UreF
VIRRYWQAAESGQASAWHVIVYGVALAVFAVPLREGLAHYAHRTTTGLINSAAGPLRLEAGVRDRLILEAAVALPATVAHAIGPVGSSLSVAR